ncbi:MAG: DciA family protein [bacterium]|nr:DciA family protein [bacterium]
MAFTPLRRLLTGAAARAGISKNLVITEVLRACQRELTQIFGTEYAKFADAVAVQKDGALVIACRSPAVAQTIRLHESAILERVRRAGVGLRLERLYLVPRSASDLREPTP